MAVIKRAILDYQFSFYIEGDAQEAQASAEEFLYTDSREEMSL